jgi:hypothetical protein
VETNPPRNNQPETRRDDGPGIPVDAIEAIFWACVPGVSRDIVTRMQLFADAATKDKPALVHPPDTCRTIPARASRFRRRIEVQIENRCSLVP